MNAYSFSLSIRIMQVKLAILFLSVPSLVVGQEETILPVAAVEGQPQKAFAPPVVIGSAPSPGFVRIGSTEEPLPQPVSRICRGGQER